MSKIPPTCMVLSSIFAGDPTLGPHPYAAGSDSLQWDAIHADTIDLIRMGFGLPRMNETTNPPPPLPVTKQQVTG